MRRVVGIVQLGSLACARGLGCVGVVYGAGDPDFVYYLLGDYAAGAVGESFSIKRLWRRRNKSETIAFF